MKKESNRKWLESGNRRTWRQRLENRAITIEGISYGRERAKTTAEDGVSSENGGAA